MIFALAIKSLRNRRFTAALTDAVHRACGRAPSGRRTHTQRSAGELCEHHLGNRPDRRRAQQPGASAAVLGVPDRQCDQQRSLGQLHRPGEPSRCRLDDTVVSGRFPSRLPRPWHHAGLLRALPLRAWPEAGLRGGKAVRGGARRGAGRGGRGGFGLQARPVDRHRARRRRCQLLAAQGSSVPGGRASWREPVRRSTAPCT